jgi:hypothetical protein
MFTWFIKSSIHKNSSLSRESPKEIWGIFLFENRAWGDNIITPIQGR